MRFWRGNRTGSGRGRGGGVHGRNSAGNRSLQESSSQRIIPFAHFVHTCQQDIICQVDLKSQVPYFNAPVFLKNREQIGRVDEIFGTLQYFCVSVRLLDPLRSNHFCADHEFFIEPQKLLPLSRFLPKTTLAVEKKQCPQQKVTAQLPFQNQPSRSGFKSGSLRGQRFSGGNKSRKYRN